MMWGKKREKPREFLLRAKEQSDEGNRDAALRTMYEGAELYEKRILEAVNPLPIRDTGLFIYVMGHILRELERQDPKAACIQKNLKKLLNLPPIELRRKKSEV